MTANQEDFNTWSLNLIIDEQGRKQRGMNRGMERQKQGISKRRERQRERETERERERERERDFDYYLWTEKWWFLKCSLIFDQWHSSTFGFTIQQGCHIQDVINLMHWQWLQNDYGSKYGSLILLVDVIGKWEICNGKWEKDKEGVGEKLTDRGSERETYKTS